MLNILTLVTMEEPDNVQVFNAEWDKEGVYFYQAFKDDIANWALENQRYGGPDFDPKRMTWIKPSFAWVLYRSGYAQKHHQNRILKIKITHDAVAEILSKCSCRHGGGGTVGRVQWDPERDLFAACGNVPRKMIRQRAIQIGVKGSLCEFYVQSIISIQDVTDLAHIVQNAHISKTKDDLEKISSLLPVERPYMPICSKEVLENLGMSPGRTARFQLNKYIQKSDFKSKYKLMIYLEN